MAITNSSIGHLAPYNSLPPLRFKTINTFEWGSGGNSAVVADQYVNENNCFVITQVTGSTPQQGNWSITYGQGTFTITSTVSENSTLTVSYIVV